MNNFSKLKLIMGSYKVNYLSAIKNILLLTILSTAAWFVYDHFNTYLSMEKTIELKNKEIKNKESAIDTLKAENKIKDEELEKLKESSQISDEVTGEDKKAKAAADDFFDKIRKDKAAEEAKVKSSKTPLTLKKTTKKKTVSKANGKTTDNDADSNGIEKPVSVSVKLSEVRLDSIYLAYCGSSNVNDSLNCSGPKLS